MKRLTSLFRRWFGYRYSAEVSMTVVNGDMVSSPSKTKIVTFSVRTERPMDEDTKTSISKALSEHVLNAAGNPKGATVLVTIC